MAEIINTADLNLSTYDSDSTYWLYNGLDCVVTADVAEALLAQCDETARKTYEFSKALQAPVLEMNLRGMLVNRKARAKLLYEMKSKITRLEEQLLLLVQEGIGVPNYNWRSPKQTNNLLYDVMQLPVQKKRNSNGVFAPSSDRKALEKLSMYFIAEPIINHMLLLRDLGKAVGFLETPLVRGRMITEYQITGTKMGRLSSSEDDEGDGTNMQNINKSLRSIFVADPGYKLCNLDLEQADSRNIGALCWNLLCGEDEVMAGAYLDACESGDLHTVVTRMVRTDLPWGTAPDREIADRVFYRDKSHRDANKSLGHATNFLGKPPQISTQTKVPLALVKEFQPIYFKAFPAIPLWHQNVFWQIEHLGFLQNLFGRRRFFFGRPKEGETRRQAVAYEPSSMTADETNLGMLKLWREDKVQILAQGHDAVLFQYKEEEEDKIIPWAMQTLPTNLVLAKDREFVVPMEAKTGWNWGEVSETNPDGLRKWKGSDDRKRTETNFQLSLADF